MPTRLTDAEFAERFTLPGWRISDHRLEAVYVAPNYEMAAQFVLAIARAAESAVHHPDIDLRYPGRVHVYLTTHEVRGLTELDASLATTITRLASDAGAVVDR